ncbi:hypothetical protein HAX54_005911 [Datura stramonium]|uniref:Uncharacterized protein n=1 Tax=Datura stramonium TaxID=4076 RepID=A0ABS8T9K7_DATST|nr:hypothetical protein [Datura stramonium]
MSSSQFSPSMAPDGILFSGNDDGMMSMMFPGDHSFAVHGQIMLVLLVLLSTIFLLSMILMLCMKYLHLNCTTAKSNKSPLEEVVITSTYISSDISHAK